MLQNRRQWLTSSLAAAAFGRTPKPVEKAAIAITLDLEMSRHYPRRGMTEWDYQKGNLDGPTKGYSVEAGKIVRSYGGVIHFFCVGRVLEQPDVSWIQSIAESGHPIGNHTYDHVNVLATKPTQTQFRFQRSPWLVKGKSAQEIIHENVLLATAAMKTRAGIKANGFRTPGGFYKGLGDRPDVRKLLMSAGFDWVSAKYPRHDAGVAKQRPTEAVFRDIVRAQSEAQPFRYPDGLIEIPMSPISDVNAFRTKFWKLDYFLEAIRRAVTWAIEHRAVFDFLCHPSCMVVEDPEFKTIRMICDLVRANSDRAEIVGLDAIAKRVPK